MSDMPSIVFFDIEASGLEAGSFPIEIGWAFLYGESGSVLIKPATGWSLADWDPMAEELHGIGWQQLQRQGRSAWDVAIEVNRLFGDTLSFVVSDAPLMDGFWLDRLFEQSPVTRAFQLADFDAAFRQAFPTVIRSGHQRLVDDAERPHRAEPDALLLRDLWFTADRASNPQ